HRNAGVCRNADAEWDTRHDLVRNALRVQKERFFSAAIEDEWIAAFQAGHQLAFASFVGEEKSDRVLLHRLSSRTADVDQLSARPCLLEYSHRHFVIVNHDIGTSQALEAVHGDEARVSGSGPNQINSGILHW